MTIQTNGKEVTGINPRAVGYEIRLGISSVENRRTKARRYLIEGRLEVRRIDEHGTVAICRGNGATYELGWSPDRGWHCDCIARVEDCCHVLALKLVTNQHAGTNGHA